MGLISEQPKKPLEPWIIKLFKVLDVEKKNKKTRADLLDYIKTLTPYMNIPEGYELFLLELFLLNYRKDGDYSQLSKENYIDPRSMKGKTTPNTLAWRHVIAQLPFNASNLRGFWEKDRKGEDQYVVISYGWYPIYIFKNDKWYEVVERYSSSTSKQMSNSNPVTYDRNIGENVYRLTAEEMRMLRNGSSQEDIFKSKFQKFKKIEDKLKSSRKQWFRNYNWGGPNVSIKYKVNSIDTEGDKPIVTVDVIDVSIVENGVKMDGPENYTKGEIPGVDKQYVEDKIKERLRPKFREFIGTRPYLDDETKFLVDFNFNHLKA